MTKSFKFLICLILIFLMVSSVFAAGGVMSGEKNIRMVQTEYFDIIYADSTEDSAALLYANADKIYRELDDMYNWHRDLCHMPVVLTSKPEIFNAWYWGVYYNHIVLLVSPIIDDLDNQPDNLLWTFRHELTHAFTYNMKSKTTKILDKAFSDAFSWGILTVNPGMAEGATVTSESYEGNGRLNDEFSKQIVKQAKIENKFPKYGDVSGAASTPRKNHYYYFNGAFHEYLQKNYGLDKYRDFWYKCINETATVEKAFKRTYSISLSTAWEMFEKAYEVPQISDNPIKSGYAQDFFNSKANNYSPLNNTGAFPENLSSSDKGIIYKDDYTNAVYFVSKTDLKSEKIKPVRLFEQLATDSVSQSRDGKFITVSYYDRNTETYRYMVKIYNTDTDKWFTPKIHGIKNANVIKDGNDYYLCALRFENGKNRIAFIKLELNSCGNVTSLGDEISCKLPDGKNVSYFTQFDDGKIAYISNERLNYSIQIMNTKAELLDSYYVPADEFENFYMHYLSSSPDNSDQLYFSWVSKGTMPRAGYLDLEKGEFVLSQDDISGGMYYPVVCEDQLFYVGEFYEFNRLFRKDNYFENTISYGALIESTAEDINFAGEGLQVVNLPNLSEEENVYKYNPFRYMKRGLWLPFGIGSSESYDSKHRSSYFMPVGFTYYTKNPWDNMIFALSGCYGFSTDSYGIDVLIGSQNMGVGSTNAFQWNIENFLEFDSNGFKADRLSLSESSLLYSGLSSRFKINPKVVTQIGRPNETIATLDQSYYQNNPYAELLDFRLKKFKSVEKDFYLYNQDSLLLIYDNYSIGDTNKYSKKGFVAGIAPSYIISHNITKDIKDYVFSDITLFGQLFIPHLLPIKNQYGMVTNLPVKLFASVFETPTISSSFVCVPNNQTLQNPDLALATAEVLLFSYQFEKSIGPNCLFYLYDVNITLLAAAGYDYLYDGSYDINFSIMQTPKIVKSIIDNKLLPSTVVALKFSLDINPLNMGQLVNGMFRTQYYVSPLVGFNSNGSLEIRLSYGIDVRF